MRAKSVIKTSQLLIASVSLFMLFHSGSYADDCATRAKALFGLDLVRSLCGQSTDPELINRVVQSLKDIDGKKRVQCGLPGEKFSVCTSCSDVVTGGMASAIRSFMGTSAHRDFHRDWHQVRQVATDENKIQSWGARGWFNGDPKQFQKLHAIGVKQADGSYVPGKLAGEDFLYMHRQMIQHLQLEMALNGQPCVAPWESLPKSANDPNWPIPSDKIHAGRVELVMAKTAQDALDIVGQEVETLKDPNKLKKMSLSELGEAIENGFHADLHSLYENKPPLHCKSDNDNSPSCDDLLPMHSSPVNKHFWKIHGLVEHFIGLWLNANGYDSISETCNGRKKCYQWKGTWLGKSPSWKPELLTEGGP